ALFGILVLLADGLDLGHRRFVREADLPPLAAGDIVQHLVVEDGTLTRALRTLGGLLADQRRLEPGIDIAVQDLQLIIAVLGKTLDLLALDRHGALVLVDAVTVEHPDLDDGAVDARW